MGFSCWFRLWRLRPASCFDPSASPGRFIMLISRSADETEVFRRFLATQSEYRRSQWEYCGASHERPDFVLLDEKIGIELGEWLHEEQTAASREIDRFEKEINEAAVAHGLNAFTRALKASTEERYMTLVDVKTIPRRIDKGPAIEALLDFLRTARKPASDRELRFGVRYATELPEPLSDFFRSVHLRRLRPEDFNLGVNINRASSFDPKDAVQALLDELHDKLVAKGSLYSQSKSDRRLKQLWLVVHYGRGLRWNTPYHGIGLKEGQPLDEQTSRQIIAQRAHDFLSGVGAGAFDKVFLFFDMTPGSQAFEVWPENSFCAPGK
jgi:hypothetical protein